MEWPYNHVLIDPDPEEVQESLAQGAGRANHGIAEMYQVEITQAVLARVLEQLQKKTTGSLQFTGGERRHLRGNQPRAILSTVWWSDWLGRRHLRIFGIGCSFTQNQLQNVHYPDSPKREPLWHVHRDQVHYEIHANRPILKALCACGVIGSPQEIAWMGDRCAACHDRSQDNPEHWPSVASRSPRSFSTGPGRILKLQFSRRGTSLLSINEWGSASVWNLRKHTRESTLRLDRSLVNQVDLDSQVVIRRNHQGIYGRDLVTDREWMISARTELSHVRFSTSGEVLFLFFPNEVQARSTSDWSVQRRMAVTEGSISNGWALTDHFRVAVKTQDSIQILDLEQEEVLATRELEATGTGYQILPVDENQVIENRCWIPTAEGSAGPFRSSVSVWNFSTGEVVPVIDQQRVSIQSATALNGAYGCSVSESTQRRHAPVDDRGDIIIWDINNCKVEATLQWHQTGSSAVAISPDGQWLATGDHHGRVKLWSWSALLANLNN